MNLVRTPGSDCSVAIRARCFTVGILLRNPDQALGTLTMQESQDMLGRQSPEASLTHSVSHMHAVPPKDIAAAWNLAPADMHRRVDAAAAFNNNSSYSTAFLNSNGATGKPGTRAAVSGAAGQLPQAGHLLGSQAPPAVPQQVSQSGLNAAHAVHAAPFRPRSQQLPAGLICPLTKVTTSLTHMTLHHCIVNVSCKHNTATQVAA